MGDYVETTEDNGGVHINSGIPNHAFYLAATALGGNAWERAGRIWYETARDRGLRSTATFTDFARITVAVAGQLFGAGGRRRTRSAAGGTRWASHGRRRRRGGDGRPDRRRRRRAAGGEVDLLTAVQQTV